MIREIYQTRLQRHEIEPDPAQAAVIETMHRLAAEVADYEAALTPGLFRTLRHSLLGKPAAPRGIYIWGGVGRGKTLLMNLFHDTLPTDRKQRLHFHHFMLEVHARLAELQRGRTRLKNPLVILARQYADSYRVLCLDEFIVTNITDAMLLYGLLDALFSHGVVLVATSNRVPDDLYLNGLQRERFLPAIDLIKRCTQVMHLDSDTDHRLALLEHEERYHCPVDAHTEAVMMQQFENLAATDISLHSHIVVNRRAIPYIACSGDAIWFAFDVLCHAPRATPDYIEIAARFRTVLLSDVPVMDENTDDKARRFIYLIDELYDRRVTLIMSAHGGVEDLYQGDMLAFAFRRACSRLIEMRSTDYIARTGKLN